MRTPQKAGQAHVVCSPAPSAVVRILLDIGCPIQLRHDVVQGNDEAVLVIGHTRVRLQEDADGSSGDLVTSFQNCQPGVGLARADHQLNALLSGPFSQGI